MDPFLHRLGDEYPFEPQSIDIDGHRLSYLDEGRENSSTVLMIHGNPTWSFYYRKLVIALRDEFRVVVPDHMGCGLSDKPQVYDYSLARHIDNLERLIDSLGLDRISIAAHDWGGAIGMGCAARRRDAVRSLTLFNTAAFRSSRIPLRIRICRTPLLGDVAVRGLNAFCLAAAMGMATCKKERFTKEVSAGYLGPYGSWADRVAILRFVQDIPLNPSHKSYKTLTDIEQSLDRFADTPTALFWGMRDFCFDSWYLDQWIKKFPEAIVHRFEDAGHYVVEDAHERIGPIMRRFLQEAWTADAR